MKTGTKLENTSHIVQPLHEMKLNLLPTLVLMIAAAGAYAQNERTDYDSLKQTILHYDSLFWQAYNTCEVAKMETFLTDDVEFYHDKGGLTTSKSKLFDNIRSGLCGNPNWRLRRQAIAETIRVFPLEGYGAILSGEHVFYIIENGKPERLDGLAKFTHVWRHQDDEWKMHRILSYDHGPAKYRNLRTEIPQPGKIMRGYVGTYKSAKRGTMVITLDKGRLIFHTGTASIKLFASSADTFFVEDRDLQFKFTKQENGVSKAIVHENGVAVDELVRVE